MKNILPLFPQANLQNIYLDSASTTLKLQPSMDRVKKFYESEVSNVHRGLNSTVTALYEKSRETVAQFISARSAEEIIFTKGTTDGINFLAHTLSPFLKEGDEIVISEMEHHSNYLPWKNLAEKLHLKLHCIPVTPEGELDEKAFEELWNPRVKILSLIHQSNSIGTINPIKKFIDKAQENKAITIIDAAQSVSGMDINVTKLNCDFLVFSGHKLFSPSGVGVLYGKKEWLDQLEPYQYGGGMVLNTMDNQWAEPPHKFEAGTPNIEGVLALSTTIEFLKQNLSFQDIALYEEFLLKQAQERLEKIPNCRIVGTSPSRINILSFILEGIHTDDIGYILGEQNIFVRTGHHCCQPLMDALKLKAGTIRASFSIYSTEEDVIALEKGILKAIDILKGNKT